MDNTNGVYLSLDEEEKSNITERAQELSNLLSIWASCYPIIRGNRAAPVSVLIATVLPRLPLKVSLLVGKLILFIFAVDDVADERMLTYADFERAMAVWAEIARGGQVEHATVNDADLSDMLIEIRGELALYPLFNSVQELWVSRLAALCEAMAKEYQDALQWKASGEETLPIIRQYITNGVHSVGFPFWGTSILILLGEPELIEQIDLVNQTIIETGTAIRLYNDIRTYEKEVQEDNINAITILRHTLTTWNPILTPEERIYQAKEMVLFLAEQHAEKSITYSNQITSGTRQFDLMIRRIVAFHANFYGSQQHNHDYHTISEAESFSMIQGS